MESTRAAGGFTLVEVVIALGLFATAAVSFSSVLLGSMRGNRLAEETSTAATFAQDKIEELRMNPTLASGTDTSSIYTRTWAPTATPITGAREVAVTVTWNDESPRTIVLRTIVAEL